MRSIRILLFLSLLLVALSGCGGSGSSSGPASKVTPTFGIMWAARNRAVSGPSSALSATVKLTNVSEPPVLFTVNRPTDPDANLQKVTSPTAMTPGACTMSVTFCAEVVGGGSVVGTAADFIDIPASGIINATIATDSTIVRTKVLANQVVLEGQYQTLLFSAFDQQGNVVAVSNESAFWSVVENPDVLSFQNLKAVPGKIGMATVAVTVDKVQSTPQIITVQPIPSLVILPFFPGAPETAIMFGNALSRDGTTVVGICAGKAFRWRKETGTVDLGLLPGTIISDARAVSADGSTVVGTCLDAANVPSAFVWREATGMKNLPLPDGAVKSTGHAVSANGHIIVGGVQSASDEKLACRWTDDANPETVFPGEAHAVSDDGSVIGIQATGNAGPTGFLWYGAGNFASLIGASSAERLNDVLAMSGDASVVGSQHINGPNVVPGIWTPASGVQRLEGTTTTQVYSISGDGQFVGGGAPESGIAFVWDRIHSTRNFAKLIIAYDQQNGTHLIDCFGGNTGPGTINGISNNKMVICGTAYPAGGGAVRVFLYRGADLQNLNLR